MAEVRLAKGLQGARDIGVGVAAAGLGASILCSIFPETAEGAGLDYGTTFTALIILFGGASRAFFNWRKHRKAERQGYVRLLALAILPALLLATACETTAGFKTAAAATKITAEATYSLIYEAYLDGHVTREDKDRARALYGRYEEVQGKVAIALTDDNLSEAAKQISAATAIAVALTDLAIDLEVSDNGNDAD